MIQDFILLLTFFMSHLSCFLFFSSTHSFPSHSFSCCSVSLFFLCHVVICQNFLTCFYFSWPSVFYYFSAFLLPILRGEWTCIFWKIMLNWNEDLRFFCIIIRYTILQEKRELNYKFIILHSHNYWMNNDKRVKFRNII